MQTDWEAGMVILDGSSDAHFVGLSFLLLHWLLFFQSCTIWLSVNSVTYRFWTWIHIQILPFCLFWLPPVAPVYFPTHLPAPAWLLWASPACDEQFLSRMTPLACPTPSSPSTSCTVPSFPSQSLVLSSLCRFISDHIFSSEFAHWVFREELHFSVLVFKSYEPSGPAERQLK